MAFQGRVRIPASINEDGEIHFNVKDDFQNAFLYILPDGQVGHALGFFNTFCENDAGKFLCGIYQIEFNQQ